MLLKHTRPPLPNRSLGGKKASSSVIIVKSDSNWSTIKHTQIYSEAWTAASWTSKHISEYVCSEWGQVQRIYLCKWLHFRQKSDQELWDQMVVSGEYGFCDFKHPVKYQNMVRGLSSISLSSRVILHSSSLRALE